MSSRPIVDALKEPGGIKGAVKEGIVTKKRNSLLSDMPMYKVS